MGEARLHVIYTHAMGLLIPLNNALVSAGRTLTDSGLITVICAKFRLASWLNLLLCMSMKSHRLPRFVEWIAERYK